MIRLATLAGVLIAEALALSIWLDNASLGGQAGLPGLIRVAGPWILRGVIGFVALFLTFGMLRNKEALARAVADAAATPPRWAWLAVHAGSLAVFVWLSVKLYGQADSGGVAAWWLAVGLLAGAAAVLWALPLRFWSGLIRATGSLSLYAAGASILACVAVGLSQNLWRYAAQLTFQMVQILLRPMIPAMRVEPENLRIRGSVFSVVIDEACSGLEGASLILVFGTVLLWLFRRELKFPQSFLLLPAGAVILYLLNAVRIAGLVLIGEAGARQIALGGFHSQAGWILFNGVALGLSVTARRMPWFSLRPERGAPAASTENMTAVYLTPFLAVLAAGMVSRAVTGTFEWTYALRLGAAVAALYVFRRHYREMDWRAGWLGAAAGVLVFALWIGWDRVRGVPQTGMPQDLAAAAAGTRGFWILVRVAAAVITVPIVEELAFRGFLMRRLSTAEFDAIGLRGATFLGILGSSLAFGLMHGDRWVAGTLAGVCYGAVAWRSGRIGEAVFAHAVTNALLAALVLCWGHWQLW